jgi:23S rRNA C2498 (ribose-2'-O)-methylase RlmM
MAENTIRINGDDIPIGDAIEMWLNNGVCRACIDYRLDLNNRYKNSYNNFAHLHCKDCMCD